VTDGLRIGLAVGLILAPLAGCAAFLIVYEEYRHHYPGRGPAIRMSLQVGLSTFVVFLVLSVMAGILAISIAR
jgi:hypothetical protein